MKFKKTIAAALTLCMIFAMFPVAAGAYDHTHSAVALTENACEHQPAGEGEVKTAPTCTKDGLQDYLCAVCGETYTQVIPAVGHTKDAGKVAMEPDCKNAGIMIYTCTVCKEELPEEITAKGHTWSEGVPSETNFCVDGGTMTYTCTVCNDQYVEAVAPTGHTYGEGVVSEPTCTQQGCTTYTCVDCGHSYTDTYVEATGHKYDNGVVTLEPTCAKEGVKTYTCGKCGSRINEPIAMVDHVYDAGVVTTAPTCVEDGVKTFTCVGCGLTYTESVEALGHNFDEGVITTAPTCTESGVQTHTCATCGRSVTQTVPATGHTKNEGVVAVEPTCSAPGEMAYICTVCEAEFSEEIATLPHDFVDGVCSVCGEVELMTPVIKSCYSKVQDSVKVTWNVVENADGYELFRSTDPEDYTTWTLIKTIKDGTATYYTNKNLEVGVTYYYSVRAFKNDADGNRIYTDYSEMCYMPAAVVFDAPYSNATFRVRLRWNEVGGAHGYQIWGLKADGTWKMVKTIGDKGNVLTNDQGATTAYSNTGLVAGDTYTYKMRAFMITEDGKKVFGAYSDEYSVAVKPEAPVIAVTSTVATRAQISWEAINGAAGYQVWMADAENGEYKIVKSITDGKTTYTKYDLTSGKTYYFKVRAYAEAQERKAFSAYSDITSVVVK